MRSGVIFVLAVTILSGCATVNKQPVDVNVAATLKSQTLAQTSRDKPDFAAVTPGKAAFALVGAFAMISAGNEIVTTNKVPDPANTIARGLAQALEAKHGSQYVESSIAVKTDDIAQISDAANGKARFVIDVQTVNWSFAYFPSDWTHYRVLYFAKARLIDTEKKAVVAEGSCKHIPESNVNAPTHDELITNEAALLKDTLSIVTAECVNVLKTEMLSL